MRVSSFMLVVAGVAAIAIAGLFIVVLREAKESFACDRRGQILRSLFAFYVAVILVALGAIVLVLVDTIFVLAGGLQHQPFISTLLPMLGVLICGGLTLTYGSVFNDTQAEEDKTTEVPLRKRLAIWRDSAFAIANGCATLISIVLTVLLIERANESEIMRWRWWIWLLIPVVTLVDGLIRGAVKDIHRLNTYRRWFKRQTREAAENGPPEEAEIDQREIWL